MPARSDDEDPVRPMGDLAGPRPVALADLVEQRRPARVGQQLAAIADQAADRQDELHPDPAVGVGRDLLEPALAPGDRGLDLADVVGRDVDGDPLVRLLDLAADLAQEDLRARRGQLEALAAHLLDEDRQLELAAAADLERLARIGRADLDRDVAEDLLVEAGLDLAAGDVLALATGQRRGVDPERHPQGRGVDVEARQRPRVGRVGQRVADRHLGQAGDADDVARAGLLDVDPIDAVGGLEAGHGAAQRDGPAGLDRARASSASSRRTMIRWPVRIVPFQIRPTAIRPT